jgi:hypothetical protein
MSEVGNAWVADVYFALLTGASNPAIEVPELELRDARPTGPEIAARPGPLSDHVHFDVRLGSIWAGTLVAHGGIETREDDERTALDQQGVRSLLALRTEGRGALDGPLLPLDFVITQSAAVTLDLRVGGVARRILLGRVTLPNPELGLAVLAVRRLFWDRAMVVYLRDPTLPVSAGSLEIDGHVIADVAPAEDRAGLRLQPRRPPLEVVPLADTRIDLSRLPEAGDVVVELDGATPLRARIATYRKIVARIVPGSQPLARVIHRDEAGHAVLAAPR